MHHDSQKIKKAVKFIGPVYTRHILYDSIYKICCFCHVKIIMPTVIRLDCSQIWKWLRPKWQKCHSEHQTLFYTYVKVWAWDYSQLCYAIPCLCIQTVSSISIWGTHACLLTVKLEEHLASSLSLPWLLPITKTSLPLVSMTISLLGYSVSNCFIDK